MQTFKMNAGEINEEGYIAGFTRRGFTLPKCKLELEANCLDSLEKVCPPSNFTKKILWDITRDHVSLIDNGVGMTIDAAKDMFSMHKSNHSNDASRGVSGIGAKASLSILSKKTEVNVFTHTIGGPYIRICVPWNEIHAKGIYTGMIKITNMTVAETTAFNKERQENGMLNKGEAHGTTIRFNTNDELTSVIDASFAPIGNEDALKNPMDRAGIVFGRDQVELSYKNYSMPGECVTLQQYDYFGAPNSQFYAGKSEHQVEHWYCPKDDSDRYIVMVNGEKKEITKNGRGFSLKLEDSPNNTTGYHRVGEFTILCGMRIDTTVFDPSAPVAIKAGAKPGVMNTSHLGEDACIEFLWSMGVVRNNQLIGRTDNPYVALGSSRGSGDTQISAVLVQAEIRFNPLSSHDNRQDRVMGIQENKNQFDGNIPVQLKRIAGCMRNEKAKEVREYFEKCIEAAKPKESEEEKESRLAAEAEAKRVADTARLAAEAEARRLAAAAATAAEAKKQAEAKEAESENSEDSESEESESEKPTLIHGSDILQRMVTLKNMIKESMSYNEEALKEVVNRILFS
jgi:hypothetical protein